MKNSRTKKLTTVGMLCALAYIAVAVGRIPVVLFLKYDPKDVVIVIGGLIFGPLTSLAMAVIVSVVEMVTISSTGVWGCMMNMISSCCVYGCIFLQKAPHSVRRCGSSCLRGGVPDCGDDALELAGCPGLYGLSAGGGGGASADGISAV